ncbi:hypothetical protein GAYE_SCF37G5144 [Galdieria yellowstonensis]|uniref:Matrin-type domain-containing protein n=1 Tax=Galdieria yellowstonensis TaxID=3028027 RepID=A0AAV9IIN9_9RHOD|nr:hypothetical protein GAYE_SCF37G5144 [Galdieria yellowstonensis]
MDRDWGAKTGGGGVASKEQTDISRRERLRQLALETIDLKKDPYFMRNHLGGYECKLCLTLHTNEGNYLAHTQGRRHQMNLARRAAREAKEKPQTVAPPPKIVPKKTIKIGRPGYRIMKQRDPETEQLSLLFQIHYPEIAEDVQPRHRFMSSFEQKVERPDPRYQFVLFAAEPYETIAFKIPNWEIEKSEGKYYMHWDKDKKTFTLQIYFKPRLRPAVENEVNSQSSAPSQQASVPYSTRQPQADPFAPIAFGT